MVQVIKMVGKAKDVFAVLQLLSQRYGQVNLDELERWIAENIKERLELCQN